MSPSYRFRDFKKLLCRKLGGGGAGSAYDTAYMGSVGPKVFAVSVWCQLPSLHATWKARGVTIMHTDSAEFVNGDGPGWINSIASNGIFDARAAKGSDVLTGAFLPGTTDYSSADKANDHVLWWTLHDEPDGKTQTKAQWDAEAQGWLAASPAGVKKHIFQNYNGGHILVQKDICPDPNELYVDILNDTNVTMRGADTYPWQAYRKDYLGQHTYDFGWFINQSFFNGSADQAMLNLAVPWTATSSGAHTRILRDGPYRGQYLSHVGQPVVGNIATGRVDMNIPTSNGDWQPARYFRLFWWDMLLNGAAIMNIFPQCPSVFNATGSISSNVLTVTALTTTTAGYPNQKIRAPLYVLDGGGNVIGTITSQLTSTETDSSLAGKGTYQLTGGTNTASGTLGFRTPAFTNGDDSNAANLAELATCLANTRNLLEAHPSGGNMLMNTTAGGRKSYAILDMPSSVENPNLHVDDMTVLTAVAGTGTSGWPMGFRGAEFSGADGKKYRVVLSYSGGDSPTLFTYAPWGVSNMLFGPCEVKLFTDASQTNQFAKSGTDDGPQTYLGFAALTASQNEGNSGTTVYTFTVNRTGITSGTTTVNWAVTGSGGAPANATDFVGGTLPSGTLTFSAGDTSKTITVNVQGDTTFEPTETFAVALSSASAGSVILSSASVATGTITNDDLSSFDIATIYGGGDVGTYGSAASLTNLKQNTNGTTAVAAVNDPVGYAADLSGKGHPAISLFDTNIGPGSSTTRPLYKQAGSINYLSFDGVDDFLATTNYQDDVQSSRFALPNSTGWTEFYALRLPVTGAGKAGMIIADNSGDNRVGNYNAGQLFLDSGGFGGTSITAADGTAFNSGLVPGANTWFVLIVEHKGGSGNASMQINAAAAVTGTIGTTDGSGLLLGAGIFSGYGQVDFNTWGRIGRLLTATEKNNLRTELGARIGLSI